jgi:anti-anti-sigma factor
MFRRKRRARILPAPTVVDMPAEIDAANADAIGEVLASALVPGLRVLVADLSATAFCDVRGARAFALARAKAVDNGTALRLVVPSGSVRRVFELIELDRRVPIYLSLSAALAPEIEAGLLNSQAYVWSPAAGYVGKARRHQH